MLLWRREYILQPGYFGSCGYQSITRSADPRAASQSREPDLPGYVLMENGVEGISLHVHDNT